MGNIEQLLIKMAHFHMHQFFETCCSIKYEVLVYHIDSKISNDISIACKLSNDISIACKLSCHNPLEVKIEYICSILSFMMLYYLSFRSAGSSLPSRKYPSSNHICPSTQNGWHPTPHHAPQHPSS